MNDPSKLFRILAPFQDVNSPDKTPSKYAAENFNELFNINAYDYSELVKTAKLISTHSKNKKQDLSIFIQGAVLSKPYNLNTYTSCISSIAESQYVNISSAINSWLEDKFRTHHSELFQKLNHLDYTNTNTPFNIISSKNPSQIQQVVQKTNACINDDPLTFFEQVTKDAGTIYILAIQREQEEKFKNMKKGEPNLGYVRLNAYQSTDKQETLLSVDNIWINNNNKQLICSLVESLVDLAKHLDLPIIDKTMSRNYIMQNGKVLDIYDQQQSIFKLGHVPEMLRYNQLMTPLDNDGFYIIKSIKDCK